MRSRIILTFLARIKQQEYDNDVWLQNADFEVDLQKLQIAHISGTCAWLLQNQTCFEWRDIPLASPHKNAFLWIQGKPGSGKSVLASQVVQDL